MHVFQLHDSGAEISIGPFFDHFAIFGLQLALLRSFSRIADCERQWLYLHVILAVQPAPHAAVSDCIRRLACVILSSIQTNLIALSPLIFGTLFLRYVIRRKQKSAVLTKCQVASEVERDVGGDLVGAIWVWRRGR